MSSLLLPTPSPGIRVLRAASVLVAVAVSVHVGLGMGQGGSRAAVVLPLAAALGAVLALLAFVRFEVFVAGLLVVRASADAGKLSEEGSGLLDPASGLAMLFLLAAMLWLAARHRAEGPAPRTPIRVALWFFLAAGGVSIGASAAPGDSALAWLRMVAAGVMFLVLERLVTDGARMRRLLAAVFASAVIPLIVGFVGFATGGFVEEKGGFDRMTSTFTQSNGYSRYLVLILLMAVAVYRHVHGRTKLGMSALIVLGSVSLVLTYTRSAWLGLVIGLIVIGILQSRVILPVLLVGAVVALVAVPSIGSRLTDVTTDTSAAAGETTDSLSWRFGYWAEVLPLANESPVVGIGLDATSAMTEEAKPPHNDFLRAYVEGGLIGFTAYLALLGALVGTARQALRRARPGLERGVAVGFTGFLVSFIAISTVANVIQNVVMLWYVLALAACASAIARGMPGEKPSPAAAPAPAPSVPATASH